MMTIMAHQTAAYGQWRVVVITADGTEHEGWGLTEQQATYRAQAGVARVSRAGRPADTLKDGAPNGR